jgi:hypothetical protein
MSPKESLALLLLCKSDVGDIFRSMVVALLLVEGATYQKVFVHEQAQHCAVATAQGCCSKEKIEWGGELGGGYGDGNNEDAARSEWHSGDENVLATRRNAPSASKR